MNKIYAIIGPHASGKKMIIHHLRRLGVSYIVGHTTRKPRPTEQDGDDYYFVDKEEFFKLDLVEKTTYKGEYYGISKSILLESMRNHSATAVLLNQSGLKQLKRLLGARLESIYIMVDYVTMVERMLANNETNEMIKHNLEYAETNGELLTWKITDYVVKNKNSIAITVNQILALMDLMEMKTNR